MFWVKKVLCGLSALIFIILGLVTVGSSQLFLSVLGFGALVGGLTLGHIAIKETLPSYNFWITFVAICLAYMLFINRNDSALDEQGDYAESQEQRVEEKTHENQFHIKKISKKKKKGAINLAAYPKISGSITAVHAHVYYIAGRYVRLYGVDAPDNDQLCSDSNGNSYNCGEVAVSWIRNWIDQNPVDCYLLKIEPNGQDLATCIWGKYDIGAALVAAGWGLANTKETNIYKPYEVKAQSESAGLWQGTFYTPENWRDIKRHRNDFTIKTSSPSGGGFLGSLFKW